MAGFYWLPCAAKSGASSRNLSSRRSKREVGGGRREGGGGRGEAGGGRREGGGGRGEAGEGGGGWGMQGEGEKGRREGEKGRRGEEKGRRGEGEGRCRERLGRRVEGKWHYMRWALGPARLTRVTLSTYPSPTITSSRIDSLSSPPLRFSSPPPSSSNSLLSKGSCEWMGWDGTMLVTPFRSFRSAALSMPDALPLLPHRATPCCRRARVSGWIGTMSLNLSPPLSLSHSHSSHPSPSFDPALLLHGEHNVRLFRPLPTAAKVVNRARISALKEKGRAAIVDVETVSFDRESGARLALNRLSQPPQQPAAHGSAVPKQPSARPAPHASAEERIPPNQALLYRLCGVLNPLHSDPEFAATAGYPRPILHGLCTLGFATRAILRTCCRGDPSLFHSVLVRFTGHVFPGETLITRTCQPVSIPASSAAGEEESAAGSGGEGVRGGGAVEACEL
ncbi:unnamed protein product [Closterium sp. Naga37s-1]|nr:unnamed protein product [Closterium sp. Naga37s-1]